MAILFFHQNHVNLRKRHHVIWVQWQNLPNMLIDFVMEILSLPMPCTKMRIRVRSPVVPGQNRPGQPITEAMKPLSVSSTILFHVTKLFCDQKIIFINLINIIIFCNKLKITTDQSVAYCSCWKQAMHSFNNYRRIQV